VNITAWLHGLGLQQYEKAFRDNEIGATVLPELTSEDLRDIGVSLVGHRGKLLAAIAAMRDESRPQPPVRKEAIDTAGTAERRQLTVMFCDLVGSTALSARLDPEDLRKVIAAYHRAVAAIVVEFGGFVANYMGDGVLAYFGHPQAHENDAERGVRAELSAIILHCTRVSAAYTAPGCPPLPQVSLIGACERNFPPVMVYWGRNSD